MDVLIRTNDQKIDELEGAMFEAALSEGSNIEFFDAPINHYFTPNVYVREMILPEGKLITSEVHKTCHFFYLLAGTISISVDGGKWKTLKAPYFGVTKAGTRRIGYSLENTVWQTVHSLDFIKGDEGELPYEEMMEVVNKIKETIIEPYENKLLGGHVFLNQITNTKSITE